MICAPRKNHLKLRLRRLCAFLILGLVASSHARSQSPGDAPKPAEQKSSQTKTFEVASIRPGQKFFLKMDEFLNPVSMKAPPKGGVFSWNLPVGNLIRFAYDLRTAQVNTGMYKDLPQWAKDEYYAVEVRVDGDPSREDMKQMVRALLEDRFKLTVHAGTRDGEVNALTLVKPGVGLKPHMEGAPCDLKFPQVATAYPPYSQVPVHCGIFDRELSRYDRRIEMLDVSMAQIADTLSGHSPLPVVDATGLTGHYDGFLDYGPEILPPNVEPDAEVGSPVSIGLPKQLGMKLVKQNATVDYFDIDHIEKPSEN